QGQNDCGETRRAAHVRSLRYLLKLMLPGRVGGVFFGSGSTFGGTVLLRALSSAYPSSQLARDRPASSSCASRRSPIRSLVLHVLQLGPRWGPRLRWPLAS